MPTARGSVLVVDDEGELMTALCESLRDEGFEAAGASDPAVGLEAIRDGEFDVLLSDLMMPGTDGIQLLREALAIDPTLVGIIMTGQGSIPTAVEAMKTGAFDYILKPFRLQQVLPVLDRAVAVRRLRAENVRLRRALERLTFESPRYRIVGTSPGVRKVCSSSRRSPRPTPRCSSAGRAGPARSWSPGRSTGTARGGTGRW